MNINEVIGSLFLNKKEDGGKYGVFRKNENKLGFIDSIPFIPEIL